MNNILNRGNNRVNNNNKGNHTIKNINRNLRTNLNNDLSPKNILTGLNRLEQQIPNKQKVINDIERGLDQLNNIIDKIPEGDINIHGNLTLTVNPKEKYLEKEIEYGENILRKFSKLKRRENFTGSNAIKYSIYLDENLSYKDKKLDYKLSEHFYSKLKYFHFYFNDHFTIDFIETIDKLKELLEQGVDMFLPQAKKFIDKIKTMLNKCVSDSNKDVSCNKNNQENIKALNGCKAQLANTQRTCNINKEKLKSKHNVLFLLLKSIIFGLVIYIFSHPTTHKFIIKSLQLKKTRIEVMPFLPMIIAIVLFYFFNLI